LFQNLIGGEFSLVLELLHILLQDIYGQLLEFPGKKSTVFIVCVDLFKLRIALFEVCQVDV
jgi:hypothetical protein